MQESHPHQKSQAEIQPASISQCNHLDLSVSPGIATSILSHLISLFAKPKKKSKINKNEFASLFNDYKIRIQNADEEIFKMQDMITALTSNVACLQDSQQKLIAENKLLTVLNAELLSKSKRAPPGALLRRQEKLANSITDTS